MIKMMKRLEFNFARYVTLAGTLNMIIPTNTLETLRKAIKNENSYY